VKVVWADRMNDAKQTPYIVFQYVEGLDVSDLIDAEALSLDDSVRIARESAERGFERYGEVRSPRILQNRTDMDHQCPQPAKFPVASLFQRGTVGDTQSGGGGVFCAS